MAEKAALHLDERWDKLLDVSLRRLTYGTLAGGATGMALFRGSGMRIAAVAFGAGAGIGSAWQLCSQEFEDLVPSLLKSK